VIGETTVIGADVLITGGGVRGGTSLEKKKRHPSIGDRVVIGSRAVVLGDISIGDDVKIGSGSVVVKAVPPDSTVVGVPGRIVGDDHHTTLDLEHGRLPDPVAQSMRFLMIEQGKILEKLARLEAEVRPAASPEVFTGKRAADKVGRVKGLRL
jgi:serine O-acetyltransferase